MLKPCGLSDVFSDATLARVTIVQSPICMVTLSTLALQISISHAHYHSRKETERQLRYQVPLKEVNLQQKSSEARCTKTDGPVIKPSQPLSRVTRSMMALAAHFPPWNFVKFADYIASMNALK